MKKMMIVCTLLFLVTAVGADVNKGKRYYMKTFKQKFKMSGEEFAQLHTQAEWKALFADNGSGFIKEFSQKFPKQTKYLHNPKTWKKLQHVGDFAETYANDSGKTPTCGDTGVLEVPLDLEVKESSSDNFF